MILLLFWSCSTEPAFVSDMIYVEQGDDSFYIDQFEFPNIKGEKPSAHMDLEMAKSACESQGKRLCTAYEWRQACLGPQKQRFSYGAVYSASHCRSNIPLQSGHNSIKDIEHSTQASGSLENCKNDLEIYDMIGNLEEWVLDDFNGRAGSLEGGAWYTYKEYADCSGRYSRQPDFRLTTDRVTDSAGARCCYRKRSLSDDDIQKDAAQVIQKTETIDYMSENEIQLASGVWMDTFEFPNQEGVLPLTGLTWLEANQRCSESEKRLCSATEWAEACTNNDSTFFPYGNKYQEQNCAAAIQAPTTSGLYIKCRNKMGVQDLTGSVWEWVAQSQNTPKLNEESSEKRYELRGGSWFTDSQKARCEPLSGYPVAAGNARYPDVGFRCCRGSAKTTKSQHIIDPHLKCPTGMVGAAKSCVDQYEYPNKSGQRPKTDVTLSDAQALCRDVGKHLCTDKEWLAACEGTEGHRWAYGSQYDPSRCHHNAPDGKGKAQPSGAATNCHTTEGIFDLTGNVWEWTIDGKMHGGSWNFSSGMGQCKASAKPAAGYKSPEIGFRCCASRQEAEYLTKE